MAEAHLDIHAVADDFTHACVDIAVDLPPAEFAQRHRTNNQPPVASSNETK